MLTKITNFIFLLLIFSLPFVNVAYLPFSGQKVLITEFVFLAACLILILQLAVRNELPKFERFYLPLIFYAAALVLSAFFSETPKVSALKLVGEFYLIAIAVLTYIWISKTEDFKKLALVWIAASFIVSLVSVITIFLFYFDRSNSLLTLTLSKYGTLPTGNYPRIQSLFLNPNMFCHYLTISWVFLFAALKLEWLKQWVFFAFAPIFVIATAFTISPGIGGVILVAGIWFYYQFAAKNKVALARFSLGAGIIAAALFFVSTVGYPALSDPNAGITLQNLVVKPSVRAIAWKNSVETFLADPIFGKGLETDVAHTSYTLPSGERIYITDSHQMWLNVLGQSGIIGFFALLLICLFLLKGSKPLGFHQRDDVIRTSLAIAFISTFIYQGFFGSYENARHLWVLIGLLGWSIKSRHTAGQN